MVGQLMNSSDVIGLLKEEIKKLERLVRIFEMTYLDLKDKL